MSAISAFCRTCLEPAEGGLARCLGGGLIGVLMEASWLRAVGR